MSVNPFDLKTIVLAKHAQHVVLIHFPIALFLAGVAFDFLAQQTKRRGLAEAAYFNFLVAAMSTVMIWLVWSVHFRSRRRTAPLPRYRLAIEFLAFAMVTLTAHLGGFLSGVNGPS